MNSGKATDIGDKKIPNVSLTQLEDALEERQRPDRRTQKKALPPEVLKDRRKGDRRATLLAKTKSVKKNDLH
jgi:hypothetical protein